MLWIVVIHSIAEKNHPRFSAMLRIVVIHCIAEKVEGLSVWRCFGPFRHRGHDTGGHSDESEEPQCRV